ncbi:zinc ribbon domain-containing protein [Acidaminobacter sp. JC074]|uniref:zinc ribbon domain-containing protein n=1 Tax=Acidaminobacter sp. JC074 TaxID=2530199 RepID=UPI001F0F9CA1|nr:zinc ribbon domain-containing protein [Acidaminobacter sp. JC074]MCH4886794.1 zinc ribbon domain-containing protein [Acidaminobacter sp. JC074]
MTIICKHCGHENHLEADECVECGQPFNKDEVYVVCSTCGISNPESSKTCRSCGEKLEGTSSFVVNTEDKPDQKKSDPLKKDKTKREKKDLGKLRQYGIVGALGLLVLALIYLIVMLFLGRPVYLSPDDGFYYVTETGVLHVVDETGKDFEVAYDISDEPDVRVYGSKVYVLHDEILTLFDGTSKLISNEVTSFKVNLYGDQVLYTRYTGDGVGDLYKYSSEGNVRIDGNVGLSRYIFGLGDDVYYVNQITDDESLGLLYLKSGDKESLMIAEDVYEPLFSLRKNSVYYVREDIENAVRFDLFYIRDNRVTEIRRNVSQIYYNPKDESFTLVQLKDDKEHLYEIYRDKSDLIQGDFVKSGLYSFNDSKPVTQAQSLRLILQDDLAMNHLYDGSLKSLFNFDEFYLKESSETIYTIKDEELFYSKLKGGAGPLSLDRHVQVLDISSSGSSLVYNSDKITKVYGQTPYTYEKDLEKVWFSDDEKYILYLEDTDAYVLKLGANEPVFLGSHVSSIFNKGVYVYTVIDQEIYRYKLGKFSSNEQITRFRYWDFLNN